MATTKVAGLNKNQVLNFINTFFADFQNWCNKPNPPSTSDLEKYFSRNFKLNSNGRVICKGINDYMSRIANLRKKYAHIDFTGPFGEPVIFDNKLVIQYELDLRSHEGEASQVYILAIGSVEDNKISDWTQVTHELGKEQQWDK